MKSYILLRNTEEHGPYSLEQLEQVDIKKTDLVWVENEGTAWQLAPEIEELKKLIDARTEAAEDNTDRLAKKYNSHAGRRPHIGGLIAATFFLLASVLVIKSWSHSIMQKRIKAVRSLAAAAHAAPETGYQHALVTEMIPLLKKDKKGSPKATLNNQVSINTNHYTVGLEGGINNLQLQVHNSSHHLLQKVSVQIDYLKTNGTVLYSKMYTVKDVTPFSSKKMDVPPTKKGVKIKCRITGIQSNPFAASLVHA